LPFYLTNEHIEATLERNPDDVFHPLDSNNKCFTQHKRIRELILHEIHNTLEIYTSKQIAKEGAFNPVNFLKEGTYFQCILNFETDDDEYYIIYYVPFLLAIFLEQCKKKRTSVFKSKIDEEVIVINEEIFRSLSSSIISYLDKEDFAFLQNIKLTDFSMQTVDYKNQKILKNLYSYNVYIVDNEYELYFELDAQLNKVF